MKKLLLIAVVAILAICGVNAQTVTTWDVSEFENETLTETRVYDGLSIVAIEGANVVIESNSKNFGDLSFTKRLKTGGGGFEAEASDVLPTKRYLAFEVTGSAKITVYVMSSSSSAERKMIVSDGSQIIDELTVGGSSLEKKEINYAGSAATIYLYSRESGLNFYCVIREQGGTAIPTIDASKTVKSVEYFDVLGRRVTEQTSGLIIVKSAYNDGTTSTKKIYRLI